MAEKPDQKKLSYHLLKPSSGNNAPEERAIAEGSLTADQSLESGMILPKIYRLNFPKSYFGLPIFEIDDYYKDKKTFVVIESNWEIHRFSSEKTLIFLDAFNCIRWAVIRTICHTLFRYFMILSMLIFLIFWNSNLNIYSTLRIYFLTIFNIELNLKLIAYGAFRHPFSYFRNIWNWLDLIIIIIMTTSFILQPHYSSILDAIESLRVLKLIQLFPLARLTLKAAFQNVLLLKDLMVSFLFVYLVFTLFTLNSYSGLLRNRCQPNPVDWSENATSVQDQFTYLCGNQTGSIFCPQNYTCVANRGENPDQGLTNFDHVGYAALSTFRLMFRDFLEELYNDLYKTVGLYPFIFFLSVVIANLLFNNLFASYVAIGAMRFSQQLNALDSNDSKKSEQTIENSSTLPASIHSHDNGQSSNAEIEVVLTQPSAINENYDSPNKLKQCWGKFVEIMWEWKCCAGSCSPCRKRLEDFLFHRYFERYIYTVIAITLIGRLFDHYIFSNEIYQAFTWIFLIIDLLYIIEVWLKIIALSPRRFFSDGWNRFDFFLSLLIGLTFSLSFQIDVEITQWRIIRALRIARSWKMFGSILKIHKVSVWMVYIFIEAVAHVGTALFFHHYIDLPHRWNFLNDFESFLVVFRAFAGEWIENLLPLLAVGNGTLACIYFLVVIISSYVLVSHLFIQLVLTILDTDNLFDTDHHITSKKSSSIWHQITSCLNRTRSPINGIDAENLTEQNAGDLSETNRTNNYNETQIAEDENLAPCCWDCCSKTTPFQSLSTTQRTSCWSAFRTRAFIWSNNCIWKGFITAIIVLSCIPYAIPIFFVHFYIDCVVAAIFTLEIALQITGQGFKSYLNNGWSRFDGCITLIHIILNLFLVVNPLRILRLIPRLEHLKVVIEAVFYRKVLLLEAITVTGFVWLLFSFHFTHVFYHFNPDCLNDTNHIVYFEDGVNGFVALLQIVTFKGWIGIWHHSEDIFSIPAQKSIAFYFIGFILMGGFVCLAIIVSSFIIQNNEHKKEIRGGYIEILMTPNQRKRLAVKRKYWFLHPEKLIMPVESGNLRLISNFVSGKYFDLYSILLLVSNAIVLGFYSHTSNATNWNNELVFYAEIILILGFAIEILLQLFVYRKAYFQNSWNTYNFIMVIGVLITMFIPHLQAYLASPTLFMWLLLFRLVQWLKWVKRIVLMVRICLPAIFNVGLVVAIIMTFFAVTAMQLFAHVDPHKLHNFQDFFSANSILFEIAFFGAWDGLYNRMVKEGNLAALFVVSYIIISFFLFISSGTIIFLENCFHLQEQFRLGIGSENFENFKQTWQIFDPDATGALSLDDLADFLHYLDPPFQVNQPNDLKIIAMQFPVNKDNKVKFSDVLQNLIYHLDQEKKVPKPVLVEDEENASSSSRLLEIRQKAAQLHKSRNWCCQRKMSLEENEELTSD